jgi:hypothetical protein
LVNVIATYGNTNKFSQFKTNNNNLKILLQEIICPFSKN